ncbi:MAG TPA: GNAT family protein [Chitinophagaceae bacterium]
MLDPNFTPFPLLNTERLLLRPIVTEDVNELFFLRSNKEVMKFLDRPFMQYSEEALQLIQKITTDITNNDGITWGITLKNESSLIGTIGFWHITKEHHRAEIGYMLHPAQQGKGMMQEAITTVIDYGFAVMKLHSIEANVNPGNTNSIRLLERNQFIREAYHRENYYFDGKFLDSAIYSLLTPFC